MHPLINLFTYNLREETTQREIGHRKMNERRNFNLFLFGRALLLQKQL